MINYVAPKNVIVSAVAFLVSMLIMALWYKAGWPYALSSVSLVFFVFAGFTLSQMFSKSTKENAPFQKRDGSPTIKAWLFALFFISVGIGFIDLGIQDQHKIDNFKQNHPNAQVVIREEKDDDGNVSNVRFLVDPATQASYRLVG